MIKDHFKQQFAELIAVSTAEAYPEQKNQVGQIGLFNSADVYDLIERPKDLTKGEYSIPLFKFTKAFGQPPQVISAALAKAAEAHVGRNGAQFIAGVESAGGYLNAKVNSEFRAKSVIDAIHRDPSGYASSDIGKEKTRLVEYSSPNIAKPFGIGHLRSTVIGNSLRRIFKRFGYDVVGINYLGDWGTQFGKMIVAFDLWGKNIDLTHDAVEQLYELYVRFHTEAEKDESLNDRAREAFKRLEDGNAKAVELWEQFKSISLAEFKRIYDLLGIEFDLITGESFFNDKMEPAVQRFIADGLTEMSQGALVVQLDDPNLPPCLLKKGDGATLYATRDLAGMIWRWETYHFDESLYVVGSAQADHFKQCLGVMRKMEAAEHVPSDKLMADRVKHIDFGWVKFGEKTMSTRQGNIIFLEEVIDRAVELVQQRMVEKNPDLKNLKQIAHVVGVGAVIFSQLSVRRQKDVNFNWEQVLSFEGETGPYLQYTHARLCSLIRLYGKTIMTDVQWSLLNNPEERLVIETLADFPDTLQDAARNYDPFFISQYLLKLSSAFNAFYQRKDANGRTDKIISDNVELSAARMALVKAVQLVVKEGLYLLGLQAPEEM